MIDELRAMMRAMAQSRNKETGLGDGENSTMAPEGRISTMKLDLPKFHGTDPHC